MFLIGVVFQKSRSAKNPDKPGSVYIKIAKNRKNKNGEALRLNRLMKTGLTGTADDYIDNNIEAIKELVRLAYCIIEQLSKGDETVSVDDVMTAFKNAVRGDKSYRDIIRRAKEGFPLRSDLVNLGDDIKRFFRFNYISKELDDNSLTGYIESKAFQFKNEGKVAVYRSYLSTKNSIARFVGNSDVKLSEVNRRFVEEYAQWLTSNGVSESTQSFYLRTLRSALNYASESGLISIPDNLFEGLNTKVQIPSTRDNSLEINNVVIQKIATIDLKDNPEAELTRDMFMFSFYCHGMELVDVLNLKKSDIQNGNLEFMRRQKGSVRKVNLDKGAQDILSKYDTVTDSYLFPPMEKYLRLQHYTVADRIRKNIKLIGQQVGCPDLTFSSNIIAWQKIMSQISLSDILFGHTS